MSNVLSIGNAAPQSGKADVQMSHTNGYDALAMSYDNMHRIKSKSQHLTQQGVQFNATLNAGYDLTYTYQKTSQIKIGGKAYCCPHIYIYHTK